MANEEVPAYVGKEPGCGCAVAAVVDDGTNPKMVAKEVAEFIRDGLTVERTTVGWVRANFKRCPHKAPKPPAPEQPSLFPTALTGKG